MTNEACQTQPRLRNGRCVTAVQRRATLLPMERQPEPLDTVRWRRKQTTSTGIVRAIRGQFVDVFTHDGEATVPIEKLSILLKHDEWDPDALRNDLWAVYGVRLAP
jgi:hypothetical protein